MSESSISRSHLFTIRLWREEGSAGEIEYRGQVQHVLSGQLRHFRDWETLIGFCRARFEEMTPNAHNAQTDSFVTGDILDDKTE